jgi:hypothetical protein
MFRHSGSNEIELEHSRFCCGVPITVSFARNVGDVFKEFDENSERCKQIFQVLHVNQTIGDYEIDNH